MTRLLYITPGPVPPGEDLSRDRFTYLSEIAEGEVLVPVWWKSASNAPPYLRKTFPEYRVGKFRYHLFLAYRYPKHLRRIAVFLLYICVGLRLHRERKFDVILAYGTNRPGLAAVILKWITGARMIVELPGIPENAYRYDNPNPGAVSYIKRYLADRFLVFVGTRADCIRLFYPTQLQRYARLQSKRTAVFHDFVPVHTIRSEPIDQPFVLTVGYPWHTKGMDIAIRAFKSIAPEFPHYKLKIMGYISDRSYLDKLVDGCLQIEFLSPRANDLALRIIGACSIYLLASRTEGLPRVMLEAMAAGKPIIASVVGGVPMCIKDGENGLLFQSENIDELAAKLRRLMNDNVLRARLAQKGNETVLSRFDERAYVCSFGAMLDSVSRECCHPVSRSISVTKEQMARTE